MPPKIHSATPADVPAILRFVRELAAYEREPNAVVATQTLIHEALFGDPPAAHAVIAMLDEAPVGFALYFFNFSTWLGRPGLYLEDLYVTPAARGSGVGRALLTHLAQIAVQKNCGRMEWAVLNWNEPAINFYRSIGAKPMNEWTVYRLTGDALHHLAGKSSAG